uniref:Uncharacterized protein n=1 Tax=Arundo donax TaxID=35708 RepID=A0A0A9LC07_ARUDO
MCINSCRSSYLGYDKTINCYHIQHMHERSDLHSLTG